MHGGLTATTGEERQKKKKKNTEALLINIFAADPTACDSGDYPHRYYIIHTDHK